MKKVLEFDMSNPNDIKEYNMIDNIDVLLEYISEQSKLITRRMPDDEHEHENGPISIKSEYLSNYRNLCQDLDIW